MSSQTSIKQVLLAFVLLGFSGYELVTGTAVVRSRQRPPGEPYSYRKTERTYTVTRTEDPSSYWGQVIAGGLGGLYALFRALRGRE